MDVERDVQRRRQEDIDEIHQDMRRETDMQRQVQTDRDKQTGI